MHEHQHAPHDEFSPLDTFRILMEEKPEQAERVLRWAKSMHDAVRTVLRQQQTMVGVDQAIYPLRRVSTTTPPRCSSGACSGCWRPASA